VFIAQSYDSARHIFPSFFKMILESHQNSPGFFYVYILQSINNPDSFYTGFIKNLQKRFKDHNSGKNPHTVKYKPWRIKTAFAFIDCDRAVDFERYLKSASGRAFAKKHL
jgi:predicted GIY-YIG superfamily endonuclease